MFAMVELRPVESTFKARLRQRVSPPQVAVRQVALPHAFSFYRLEVPVTRGAVPWEAVCAAAGTLRGRLLLPQGVTLPSGCGAAAVFPQWLPLKLLCAGAVQTLARLRRDPAAEAVCVVDPAGVLANEVAAFVPLAASLCVATQRPQAYAAAARELLEQFGVSLLLCQTPQRAMAGCTVVVSESAAVMPPQFAGLLFTLERHRRTVGEVFCPAGLTLPPKFERLRAPGVDALQFAAALAELCGVEELEALRFDEMEAII